MFSRSRSFVRKFCHHSSSSSLTPYSTSSFSPSLIWRSKTSASSSTPGYLVLAPFILLFYAKQHTSASDNDGLPSPSIPKFILTSSSPEQILSKEQFKTILQKNISSLKAFSSRNIQVNIRFHGKIGSAGGESECHVVELTNIDPSSILELISTVSQILSPGTIELHSIGNDSHGGQILSFVSSTGDRSLSISGNNDSNCVLSIFKDGGYSLNDVDTITKAYQIASSTGTSTFRDKIPSPSRQTPEMTQQIPKKRSKEEAISKLQSMGINIYTAVDPSVSEAPPLTWESLAGYQHVKREIKNTILTPLLHPEVYDNITKFTRESFESNRPKAVLLEGPPGTGKTLTARIIAQESSKPMVHLPLEVISSKWYGESEKRIAEIFDCCDSLGGAVIFIDEIDSLVGSRDNIQMHEASRRILSVILQRIEGFGTSSSENKNVLICATNRKSDLDAALLSRYDVIIQYSLPDTETRKAVFKKYAKQLGRLPLNTLAESSEGMSNRDIKEICEHAERSWASKMIEQADVTGIKQGLPTSLDYLESLEIRKKAKEMIQFEMRSGGGGGNDRNR